MNPRPSTKEELTAACARLREAISALEVALVAGLDSPGDFMAYKAAHMLRGQYIAVNKEVLLPVLERAFRIFQLDAARAVGL